VLCAGTDGLEQKALTAANAHVAPVIDGKLDDACWQKCEKAVDFTNFDQPDVLAKDQTIGRVCFDDENLYVALECLESRMGRLREILRDDDGRFVYDRGETLEIFLDPNADSATYVHILVNTNGTWEHSRSKDPTRPVAAAMERFPPPVRSAAALGEDRFFVEVAIPFAALRLAKDVKREWRMNLNRARSIRPDEPSEPFGPNDNRYSSWSNTRGGFGRPQHFGILKIDNDFSPYLLSVRALTDASDTGKELKAIFEVADTVGKGASLVGRLKLVLLDGKSVEIEESITLTGGGRERLVFKESLPPDCIYSRVRLDLLDAETGTLRFTGSMSWDWPWVW